MYTNAMSLQHEYLSVITTQLLFSQDLNNCTTTIHMLFRHLAHFSLGACMVWCNFIRHWPYIAAPTCSSSSCLSVTSRATAAGSRLSTNSSLSASQAYTWCLASSYLVALAILVCISCSHWCSTSCRSLQLFSARLSASFSDRTSPVRGSSTSSFPRLRISSSSCSRQLNSDVIWATWKIHD